MKLSLIWIAAVLVLVSGAVLRAESPQITSVTPSTAKPGSELSIKGVALGKTKVQEVYLTDHKFDMRVKVLDQTDTSIRFRIPPFAKPGRMQLLVLVSQPGKEPRLLEQPVYVLVEGDKAELSSLK